MATLQDNLEFATISLKQALRGYEVSVDGLSFGNFEPFKLTPEKSNTARTIVQVTYSGQSAGDITAILFLPGDGTGDTSLFQPWQLNIPEEYRQHPERVLPRDKTGTEYELFFPFFSLAKNKVHWYAASLEELTVDDVNHPNLVVKEKNLGMAAKAYEEILLTRKPVEPRISLTTGCMPGMKRFGDPHAIYSGIHVDAIQVAGFLPIKNKENPLTGLAASGLVFKGN